MVARTMRQLVPIVIALAVAICLVGTGCAGGERANASVAAEARPNVPEAQAQTIIQLAASQLNAIRIEPVGSYWFAVEKEAVGNIDFDEDLDVIEAESALIGAAATFELTGKVVARARDLYAASGSVPQKELEQAVSDYETAAGALKAARDSLRALGKTDVEIDRMIAARKIETGNTSLRWVAGNVTESDLPFIRVGQPVEVRLAARSGQVFQGHVSRIYAVVDPATHRSKIRCAILDPGNELRPGMLASFTIRVQDPLEAPAVPADALVREGDGTTTAWVTSDRRQFRQRIIKAGLRQDDRVQILAGLKPGEMVVTEGGVFLSNLLEAPPSD
jgi:cobalt-zinc-cadmium efflux system membrane fusion protein